MVSRKVLAFLSAPAATSKHLRGVKGTALGGRTKKKSWLLNDFLRNWLN